MDETTHPTSAPQSQSLEAQDMALSITDDWIAI